MSINVRKKKGSSLLMVLVAALLVISLGIMALSMSLSNVRMASKVKTYSKEYYELEKVSQEIIAFVDKNLSQAEQETTEYMGNEIYRLVDFDASRAEREAIKTANELKFEPYQREEYASKAKEKVENYKKVYDKSFANLTSNQTFFHKNWQEKVQIPSTISGNINTMIYADKLDKFYNDAFNRVYYNITQKLLLGGSANEKTYTNSDNIISTSVKYKINIKIKDKNKNYSSVTGSTNWDNVGLEPKEFIVEFTLTDSNGKELDGEFSIIPPVYTSVDNKIYKRYMANPIWTNALLANGNIEFKNSTSTINGDLVSMAGSKGILFNGDNTSNIKGNLICSNNITLDGKDNSVTVSQVNSGMEQNFKKSIFGDKNNPKDNFFFNNADSRVGYGSLIYSYTEGSSNLIQDYYKFMPLFFDDFKAGNTYCNAVYIEDRSKNSHFTTRNIMFKDRIQITAREESGAIINGNAIGVSSGSHVYPPLQSNLPTGNVIVNGAYRSSTQTEYNNIYNGDYFDGLFQNKVHERVLKYKTQSLGMYEKKFGDFTWEEIIKGKSEDITGVEFYDGNHTLTLNGDKQGIIYCKGNLKINGSGTFKGTIICQGNVEIGGNVTLTYDEVVIKNKFVSSKGLVGEFFQPGQYGEGIDVGLTAEQDGVNTRAKKRVNNSRYSISKWVRK